MSQHARIADRLTRQSAEQLVTMAGAVVNGLTGNPAFPAPPVDLKAVQAAADGRIVRTSCIGIPKPPVPRSKSASDKEALCQLHPVVCRDSSLQDWPEAILLQSCVVGNEILAHFWHASISESG